MTTRNRADLDRINRHNRLFALYRQEADEEARLDTSPMAAAPVEPTPVDHAEQHLKAAASSLLHPAKPQAPLWKRMLGKG